jgi:endonuclease/exonuclease/phosphatase family metal-dependent hydrolase
VLVRTWNLFHGNAVPPERRAFLREMVELVTADGPDVVCLQELPVWALHHLEPWSGMRASWAVARRPLLWSATLGKWLTDLHHGVLRSAFTGEADAILTARRLSLSDARSQQVSTHGLRRIVHGVRLDGDVYVANFHTTGDEQLRRVADFVAGEERVILGGDANVWEYDAIAGNGFSEPLHENIDQVLVRGLASTAPEKWLVARHTVGGRILSDHAPVELETA